MITKNRFLWILRLEGISLLLLFFVAMPLKYVYGEPIYTRYVGSIHGVLFLTFLYALIVYSSEQAWSGKKTTLAFLSSMIPFGTFLFEKKL